MFHTICEELMNVRLERDSKYSYQLAKSLQLILSLFVNRYFFTLKVGSADCKKSCVSQNLIYDYKKLEKFPNILHMEINFFSICNINVFFLHCFCNLFRANFGTKNR